NVVANGTGSLNLTDLTPGGSIPITPSILWPVRPEVELGLAAQGQSYTGFSRPPDIGPGGVTAASSESGTAFELVHDVLWLASSYKSGDQFTSGGTWDNTTISGLGLTPGTYEWTWGSAANGTADDIKVVIPSETTGVPEPSTLTL